MLPVLLLLISVPRPAYAAPGLSLSLDRTHWSDSIDRELFESSRTWVPGDESTVTFWVRNTSGVAADLRIDVVDARGTLQLGRDVLLTAVVDGRRSSPDGHLVTAPGVDTGPRRVDLTASMPRATGNTVQQRHLTFRLRVSLVGQLTPTGAGAGQNAATDRLSDTGSPAAVPAAVIGGLVLMIAGGLVTRARGRRT